MALGEGLEEAAFPAEDLGQERTPVSRRTFR